MENRRPKNNQIGRSKADAARCKKHPKHQQQPGVCSVCLSERLSQLSSTSSSSRTTMAAFSPSSSSLSFLSSRCSSSELSPVHRRFRLGSEAKASMSFLRGGKNVLAKSRSMVFFSRAQEGEGRDGNGKKKRGFWSKLFLRPRSKKNTDGGLVALVHSRTMRERVISTSTRVR
ncbi:hypothetical protein U1Q18_037718 [Sarracenia purpurea var. burkii]